MITDELIKKCAENNRIAQKELYDILSPKMFSICFKYMKNKEQAEDVFQDCFVKLFTKINQFKFKGSFEGWARKIFVNRCIEKLREDKKHSYESRIEGFEELPVESKHPNILDILGEGDILKFIDSLSKGYKTIFRLYAIEGFNHKEIASKLNISDGTSKSQLARARYLLKKMITESNGVYQGA